MLPLLYLFILLPNFINCYRFVPRTPNSVGEVWPKPQWHTPSDNYLILRPEIFEFVIQNGSDKCPLFLEDATNRYWSIIAGEESLSKRGRFAELANKRKTNINFNRNFQGFLDKLYINLNGPCREEEYPTLNSSESCKNILPLVLGSTARGTAPTNQICFVYNGRKLFECNLHLGDPSGAGNLLTTDLLHRIIDFPRFPHRGLLLDTARHFIPPYSIYNILDAMSYNKMNVFHWHLTDDQSFPYQSKTFPELSKKGAYHPVSKIYSQYEISRIISYARRRGIRVIPEFDSPGHTLSWTRAFPELQTTCDLPEILKPLDPVNENTYDFLEKFFKEIWEVFPDRYIHLGGDEVNFTCWSENENVTSFMEEHNITKYSGVENYYLQRLLNITANLQAETLVWEEVFSNGVEISNSTIVQIWKDEGFFTLKNVTAAGKLAVFSSCWYLDHLANGGDWIKYYECDPQDFNGTAEEKARVIGGEACMWSEVVNEYNVISRIWPRASAVAEKLWSAQNVNNIDDAARRLEEHACRMNRRGIGAQPPNGPGVCL